MLAGNANIGSAREAAGWFWPIAISRVFYRHGEKRVTKRIYLLNGPNLNLLGLREPHIYGHTSLAEVEAQCRAVAERHHIELIARQTNAEHEMIGWLQEARRAAGIVINPAAFCYHSVAVLDALLMCECPIVEVHISNIYRREEAWRAHSLFAKATTGMITGLGTHGYILALEHLAESVGLDGHVRPIVRESDSP
jgi:3-dehydroquinate dehydratase II